MQSERPFLARHLRRLSMEIMEAGQTICQQLDPELDPTWASLLGHLEKNDKLTVMDTARKMGISHVYLQKLLKSMKAAKVVIDETDPKDARRTYYRLTKKGRALLPKVEKISEAISLVIDDIEQETGDDLFAAVLRFQAALDQHSWAERVSQKLEKTVGIHHEKI